MTELKKVRVGIVKLSLDFNRFDEAIRFRKGIFNLVTPVDLIIDNSYYGRQYQNWLCYSEKFREVAEGEKYPEYIITIHQDVYRGIYDFDVEEKK